MAHHYAQSIVALDDPQVRSVEVVRNNDANSWNRAVLAMNGYDFRQSYERGEFQRRLGWTPYRIAALGEGGVAGLASVLVKATRLGAVMYIPRGPLLRDPAALTALTEAFTTLGAEVGAVALRASCPNAGSDLAEPLRFRPLTDKQTLWNTPRLNMTLDLSRSLAEIRSSMRKKTRQYLDRAASYGVKFESALDPERLSRLTAENGLRQGFKPPSLAYFRNLCEAYAHSGQLEIWFATANGVDLAGLLTITYGANLHLRHLGLSPNGLGTTKVGYGIYWHAICRAYERQCRTADWGAIFTQYPPRKTDRGYPLYRFKSGFGCKVEFSPSYLDLVFKPFRYKVMRSVERTIIPLVRASLSRSRELRSLMSHLPEQPSSRKGLTLLA